ncbi:MAG: aminotransferase class I/II-fold pyridoxal phosphate-dependent enzyme [Rhodothermales bacterium]|nr:aminotransferase class I/II-fold pyridoxal phosphate-dependent enzyme [Rhodothermales bacterium]
MSDHYRDETQLSHLGENREDHQGAVVPPIFQNSLFTFESWDAIDEAFSNRTEQPIYSRGVNPTVVVAEKKIAHLARGEKAKLFGSGMAAILAAIMACIDTGDHVVAVKNIYGPANNLLSRYLKKKMGIEVSFVEGSDPMDFARATTDRTRLYYLESPSTAVFSIQDLPAIASIAQSRGIKTVIDNTWATPLYQKPLTMGIDLEVHTCSKYLGGHSDIIAGVVIGTGRDMTSIASTEGELLGAVCSPQTAWLINRSMRTLLLRLKAHQENAFKIARFLEGHPGITRVYYPGLESHPQHELAKRQMSGFTGLMAFELAASDLNAIKKFFNSLELFQIGVSWGGHESLIYAPAISYLKEFTPEQFDQLGISLGLMRISIGLEHPDDLISDLSNSLAGMG